MTQLWDRHTLTKTVGRASAVLPSRLFFRPSYGSSKSECKGTFLPPTPGRNVPGRYGLSQPRLSLWPYRRPPGSPSQRRIWFSSLPSSVLPAVCALLPTSPSSFLDNNLVSCPIFSWEVGPSLIGSTSPATSDFNQVQLGTDSVAQGPERRWLGMEAASGAERNNNESDPWGLL